MSKTKKIEVLNREIAIRTVRHEDYICMTDIGRYKDSARTDDLIRVKNEETGETEEVWTGDYVFENEWQSFRTKKDRSLELKSIFQECAPGRRKITVKVVDIFGNDTMKIVEVMI